MADLEAILKNPVLYEDALSKKEKVRFNWHTHADDERSSQVFCLSAFGSLRRYKEKDEIINSLFGQYLNGIEPGKWTIKPEATNRTYLGESGSQPTSIDMLFISKKAVVCMESKFIEDARTGFGGCSQYKSDCNGFYGPGSDNKCGTKAWCRLENWDGRRSPRLYWSLAKRYFKPEVFQMQVEGKICPFAQNYQLMRNVLFAATMAEKKALTNWRVIAICPRKNVIPLTDQMETFKKKILLPEFQDNVQLIHYEDYISLLKTHLGKPYELGTFLGGVLEDILKKYGS